MMFCQKCGETLQDDAKFCAKCGSPTSIESNTTGHSSTTDFSRNEENAIWNPNAASNWSLIFTPAFGSYLHALNWRALGEKERANSAMGWFYFSLFMLLVYIFMGMFIADEKAADGAARGLGFLYLIIWYFSAGRSQAKYVKEKYGKDYPRRGWGKPLLIGVVCFLLLFPLSASDGLERFRRYRLIGYDLETKSQIRKAAVAEETFFAKALRYTDNPGDLQAQGLDTNPKIRLVLLPGKGGLEKAIVIIGRHIGSEKVFFFNSTTGEISETTLKEVREAGVQGIDP